MSSLLLYKKYCGEGIADVDRDVSECFSSLSENVVNIPADEHGFHRGEFKVTVEWVADDRCWCTGFEHQTSCKNHWTNHPDGQVPY